VLAAAALLSLILVECRCVEGRKATSPEVAAAVDA
jgi:hypothetical protein